MVENSHLVYRNLLLRTPKTSVLLNTPRTNVLSFDVLALSVTNSDGTLDEEKLRELIRLFRPDRHGMLSE
jgi:hypothetical protein